MPAIANMLTLADVDANDDPFVVRGVDHDVTIDPASALCGAAVLLPLVKAGPVEGSFIVPIRALYSVFGACLVPDQEVCRKQHGEHYVLPSRFSRLWPPE